MSQGQDTPAAQGQAARVIANRYAVLREIGRGGMGVVWLAEDQMIGRRVAIKELHLPDGVPTEERDVVEQRVLREARTAGRLNDPGIVTVYDVLQESGGTYIVMELLEAPTLSDVVRDRGPLPAEQVASLGAQLLSALDAAHAAGVVHRDVKPSNIMLLPNGHVKLTDFGIAQSLDDPRLTSTGVLIGSPIYMAPERIRGDEATASSDLFALGTVLFFATEGYAPFERQTTAATMHAVLNEVPYLTKVTGPLASAITGLMVGSPQGRLSAAQARSLLTQVGAGDLTTPVKALPGNGTALYATPGSTMIAARPGAPTSRRRWLVPLVAVVALIAGLAGGFFGHDVLAGPGAPAIPAEQDAGFTYGLGGDLREFTFNEYSGTCLIGQLAVGRTISKDSASVDCAKPHDLEVIDTWDIADRPSDPSAPDWPYPSKDLLIDAMNGQCRQVFEGWIPQQQRPGLHYRAVVPAEQAWSAPPDNGDSKQFREAYCVVFMADGTQLARSVLSG